MWIEPLLRVVALRKGEGVPLALGIFPMRSRLLDSVVTPLPLMVLLSSLIKGVVYMYTRTIKPEMWQQTRPGIFKHFANAELGLQRFLVDARLVQCFEQPNDLEHLRRAHKTELLHLALLGLPVLAYEVVQLKGPVEIIPSDIQIWVRIPSKVLVIYIHHK